MGTFIAAGESSNDEITFSRIHRRVARLAWLAVASMWLAGNALAAEDAVFAVDVSNWSSNISSAEVACWRDGGVEHVIVGTQVASVARQQLQMAEFHGMSLDAYVVLYWNFDITNQVNTALAMIEGFPVRRLWLDIEVAPGAWSAAQVVDKIRQGEQACGDMPCGIYTRKVWWLDNLGNTTAFSHLPVWYAYYDGHHGFDDWYEPFFWYEGPFGGWTDPTGKQYDSDWTAPDLCGVNVDYNVMFVAAAEPGAPPPAPTGQLPASGAVIGTDAVTLSVTPVSGAMGYEFEIEYRAGDAWLDYFTYASSTNVRTFWPAFDDTAYRWRVRAENAFGWGEWSVWADFEFGNVRHDTVPTAPTGLRPDGGEVITTTSVTLALDTIADATRYEFDIQYSDGTTWRHYYTYTRTTSAQTFWPVFDDTEYRWRARAENAMGWGAWSAWAGFDFGHVSRATPPSAPSGLSPTDGAFVTTPSVTLSVDAIDGATGYEFAIEYLDAGTWRHYFTYGGTASSRTFWPVRTTMYRWRVRAKNEHGWGPWSVRVGFDFAG
jgi:hypothetical protein